MSDDRVRTRVRTAEGWIDFQDYFVRLKCAPEVREIAFEGAAAARPLPEFMAALADPRLRAVVVPVQPFHQHRAYTGHPGVREALLACAAPVIAVAPIIGGRAVKGPTAKMMRELGIEVSAGAVARRYGDLIDAYVVDHADVPIAGLDAKIVPATALMVTLADREALARVVLAAADELQS